MTTVREATRIRNKGGRGNTPVPPGAAPALILKKTIKKTGKIARLKAQLTKLKNKIRKIIPLRKMKMAEKIAKPIVNNLIDL